jgi:hypothetical protein
MIRKLVSAMTLVGAFAWASPAAAGNIYLTGHDVLLHSGQNDYDNLILDYLRGAGTSEAIAAGSYDILLLRGFSGSVGAVGVNTLEGFGTVTTRDIADFAGPGGGAALTAAMAGNEVIVIPSHTSCGGCDVSTADADILEARAAEIAAFFNAGGDIYGNSGASDTTYYNFLPPSAAASGAPIGGSSGFQATAAGVAIGIENDMINGFPTHNRFTSFDDDFTVFEIRPQTAGPNEVISIGLRGGRIVEDDIVVDDTTTDDGTTDDTTVPEPTLLALFGIGMAGAAAARRRRRAN